MKLEIISGGEFGVEQGALSSGFINETPTHGYIRKGFITSQGLCEKVKYLGVTEIDTDRIRDCAQKCIDECDGILIFKAGDLAKVEENIIGLVQETKPIYILDFQKPDDPRCVTSWALVEGITKLYVTGRMDTKGSNMFFKKTYDFMNILIKDLNGEFNNKELSNRKKTNTEIVKSKAPDEN